MLVVKNITSSEYEIKKSKFISYIAPYDEFETLLDRLKKEHPKARHFVYAYRYLNEYNQIVENSSDDGEPKGTSGKPTLAPMAGKGIVNSCIITVRYFGGIKLGTGGLVRAYSDSANLVISKADLKEYKQESVFDFEIDYNQLQRYEYVAKKLDIKVLDKIFSDKVVFKIICEDEKKDLFEKEVLLHTS